MTGANHYRSFGVPLPTVSFTVTETKKGPFSDTVERMHGYADGVAYIIIRHRGDMDGTIVRLRI